MARIEFAGQVTEDVDRIFDHLALHDVENAPSRIQDIIAATDVLVRNPLIGRLSGTHHRELVIGRRSRGYVALYRYVPELDTVFILAIRSQGEAGYARP
ncbi:MAG: type II toxin-antitoxin system RelE/ParE family toxin [Methylibium sp.]|uniref:type II toxin-antitoxin system RelE/ParE family toxin n=1 Tax=Methylibium sp. TaxID=2067992 RepID=UPI00179410C5|nr:type II toxin-antitoxin system RelE/ParE family toxin [Methylibium sp.]MBA3597012.1 type II toxin-antitoxin system RelE/ParE family toxin [Methylibium sp.]